MDEFHIAPAVRQSGAQVTLSCRFFVLYKAGALIKDHMGGMEESPGKMITVSSNLLPQHPTEHSAKPVRVFKNDAAVLLKV